MKIGVTGGIGTGKSTACKILEEMGLRLIDVDRVYHELLLPGSAIHQNILSCFGSEYFTPEGILDRKRLGSTVFKDPEKLRLLGAITHPWIKARLAELLQEIKPDEESVVIDHPLLFEMKMEDLADEIWVVAIPEEIQIERLMRRNNLSRSEAIERIKAQMPLEEKISRADVVIDNSGSREDLKKKITELWGERCL